MRLRRGIPGIVPAVRRNEQQHGGYVLAHAGVPVAGGGSRVVIIVDVAVRAAGAEIVVVVDVIVVVVIVEAAVFRTVVVVEGPGRNRSRAANR